MVSVPIPVDNASKADESGGTRVTLTGWWFREKQRETPLSRSNAGRLTDRGGLGNSKIHIYKFGR